MCHGILKRKCPERQPLPLWGKSDPIQRRPVGEDTGYPGPGFMCFNFLLVSDVGYYSIEFHLNIVIILFASILQPEYKDIKN